MSKKSKTILMIVVLILGLIIVYGVSKFFVRFFDVFERAKSPDISINVFSVGERPCSITPQEKVDELKASASKIVRNVTEKAVIFESASTDCNIPLSLGIPAICVGVNNHNGIHTREEWVEKESLTKGLEIAINLVEKLS